MNAAAVLAVMVGAAVGAPLRYGSERLLLSLTPSRFPWGTLIANLVGCTVAGGVTAAARAGGVPDTWLLVIVSGFCGALTTFSGFAAQVLELGREGARPIGPLGLAYAMGSIIAGIVLASVAYATVSAALS